MSARREFEFTDKHFKWLVDLVMEKTGIALSNQKRDLVYGRLARRIRKLDLNDFDEYCDLLKQNSEEELVEFINSITTNLTSFYREPHHFEYMANTVLKYLLQQRSQERRIRIWSAGCSTGEEPYTIAMTVLENVPDIKNWDLKILATDIDTNVLSRASEGVYLEERMNGVSKERMKKWFLKPKNNSGEIKVSPS